MPTYTYKAKTGPHNSVVGTIDAKTKEEAVNKIIQSGYIPTEVAEGKTGTLKISRNAQSFLKGPQRIPLIVVSNFVRQECDLMEAGVPLLRSLELLGQQTQHLPMKKIVENMTVAVRGGDSLSDAMSQHPQAFSMLSINMVRSGEISGNVTVVFDRLAQFLERDLEIRSQIRSSLMYPAVIMVVGFLTLVVLMTFVLPRLTSMFEDFDAALPIPTQIVIALSNFLGTFWWALAIAAFAVGVLVQRFLQTYHGKVWKDNTLLKIPIVGKFILQVELGRFARTLGTLIDSGVSIVPALESTTAILENIVLKQDMQRLTHEVKNGASLTQSLVSSRFLSNITASMIAVGEETGNLQKGLFKLANNCERQTSAAMKDFMTIFGPAILITIVGIVGFVIIAMLLPIFQMSMIIK